MAVLLSLQFQVRVVAQVAQVVMAIHQLIIAEVVQVRVAPVALVVRQLT
jgi:hypothetical protein